MIKRIIKANHHLLTPIRKSVAQQQGQQDYEKIIQEAKKEKMQAMPNKDRNMELFWGIQLIKSNLNNFGKNSVQKNIWISMLGAAYICGWSTIDLDFSTVVGPNCPLLSSLELNNYNYSEIKSFTDRHEPNVYLELRRMQNSIYWSLDDFFVYSFHEKPLEQIICQDMGLYPSPSEDVDEEKVKKVKEYLQSKMKQLKQVPLTDIRKGSFRWTL